MKTSTKLLIGAAIALPLAWWIWRQYKASGTGAPRAAAPARRQHTPPLAALPAPEDDDGQGRVFNAERGGGDNAADYEVPESFDDGEDDDDPFADPE